MVGRVGIGALIAIAAATVAAALAALAFSASAHAATITVDTVDDDTVGVPGGTADEADDGDCTIAEAIDAANNDADHGTDCVRVGAGTDDTIDFDISPDGLSAHVITVADSAGLPTISDKLVIDGDANDPDPIEIDGSNLSAFSIPVLSIAGAPSNGSRIDALSVYNAPESNGSGINLSSDNNIVENSFVGTDAVGSSGIGNAGSGVTIGPFGDGNTVRDSVLSGNDNFGLVITGNNGVAGGDGNIITGNVIGTNAAGTSALANGGGIGFTAETDGNVIGGNTLADGNLISGNTGPGIHLAQTTGPTSDAQDSTTIRNNRIGTNVGGSSALPNGSGIEIDGLVTDTLIDQNLISGNTGDAITLTESNLPGNGEPGPSDTIITGNLIGTDATGANPLPNSTEGISITGTAQNSATNNRIGGTAGVSTNGSCTGDCNVIANNGRDGVALNGAASGPILGNSIFDNDDGDGGNGSELGIDLKDDGVTENDGDDPDLGPNGLQNFPDLTSATSQTSTNVVGTLDTDGTEKDYRIEFFANSAGDPSGNGEGERFLGGTTVSTDPSGDASFSATVAGLAAPGDVVTATATRLDESDSSPLVTSEFSDAIAALVLDPPPPPPTSSPAADTSAPVITLGGKKTQKSSSKVKVKVTCSEDCSVDGTGTIKIPKVKGSSASAAGKAKFKLKKATAELQAGETVTVTLKLKSKAQKALKKALKKREKSTAKVTITATDGAGNESSAKRKIKVKK